LLDEVVLSFFPGDREIYTLDEVINIICDFANKREGAPERLEIVETIIDRLDFCECCGSRDKYNCCCTMDD